MSPVPNIQPSLKWHQYQTCNHPLNGTSTKHATTPQMVPVPNMQPPPKWHQDQTCNHLPNGTVLNMQTTLKWHQCQTCNRLQNGPSTKHATTTQMAPVPNMPVWCYTSFCRSVSFLVLHQRRQKRNGEKHIYIYIYIYIYICQT